MLFQLHTGRVEGYTQGQTPLIYLVSTAQTVQQSGAGFVFSDGHGIATFTNWFDDLGDLDEVDWDAVYARIWRDTVDDMDRQRRKQAEFLVHQQCDWTLIHEIAVISDNIKTKIEGILAGYPPALRRPVIVRRDWYLLKEKRSMIGRAKGNLIVADVEALVSTVNCEGFMGKGLALQFKKAFPENFDAYQRASRAGEVQPGKMFVFPTRSIVNPKYIINFPTKRRWREKSKLADIESGLKALVEVIRDLGIKSVAVPPLGCGLGGLKWRDVGPRIENAFRQLPDVEVLLFEPSRSPEAKAMPVRTKRPKLTLARALLIRLMQQYSRMAYRLTLLEIQKMAYFLQESGQPLQLNYVAHVYGPYAHNLNKVLEILEGHFIRGYGDTQKPDVEIKLLPGAAKAAEEFLAGQVDSGPRLQRVAEIIEGFETPYGMELLSSVHWVATHQAPTSLSADEAVQAIHCWNERKRQMFRPDHIRVAWDRLRGEGLLAPRLTRAFDL